MHLKIKNLLKAIIFLIIGTFLFAIIQNVFMPKRVSSTKAYDAGKLAGFYNEEENSIDVLICSTSHASKGILPMELYETYGITSYNLSTSIQPIEATYYTLAEALNTQKPKVFIYDVSSLYFSSVEAQYWWFILDEMRMGPNKAALLREYKRSANGGNESKGELIFPLVKYHERWKELKADDFTVSMRSCRDYSKGGQINSAVEAAEISVEEMNLTADILIQSMEKSTYVYSGEKTGLAKEQQVLCNLEIPEKNIEWLEKIKALCDEHNVQLLAVKVPTVYMPQTYRSAWIEEKYRYMKTFCEAYGIAYYDLLYDTDIAFDWSRDTLDEGQHVNLNGARKVSADLGAYLMDHYDLMASYNEQWDKDLSLYQEVRKAATLELGQDFVSYIHMLANEYRDKMILISAANDMAAGLNGEEVDALRSLGLQADFGDALNKQTYIAVIEGGEVKYEASSDRQLSYGGTSEVSDTEYELYGSGWLTGSDASIKLDRKEYAYNPEAFNIVVYDDERDLILDSVSFGVYTGEGFKAERNNAKTNSFEENLERYITETKNQ